MELSPRAVTPSKANRGGPQGSPGPLRVEGSARPGPEATLSQDARALGQLVTAIPSGQIGMGQKAKPGRLPPQIRELRWARCCQVLASGTYGGVPEGTR